jgi:phage terminase large subunit GpA-like protein
MTSTAIDTLLEAFWRGWKPEPALSVSEWADTHRMLSSKGSAEPGQWRTSRTPYLREIMDTLSALHPAQRVVLMKGAQIGATECGNNWLGYLIHHAPAPTLYVEPTVEVAKRVSKQRIAPMIEATPALRGRVAASRSRDSGNTMFVKEFEGGLLIITGANSGSGLRSMPIRNLFMDEVDEYPGDVDGQGDPVSLAEKRTTTFARRKVFLVSTPTIKGLSRIEREFLASDQRRYFVPCPHCAHMDWIRWPNIRWEDRKPETAKLYCECCGGLIEERHKTRMLERGEWRPTAEGDGQTVGFHLSGLYSPLGWKSWKECVQEFIQAKDDPFRLKTWINTVLGESWEERGDSVEPDHVLARAEHYPAEVPNGVGILVAGVDVQGDRLEAAVHGFGAGEESWLIAWTQIHGDPGRDETWRELDRFLFTQKFEHESRQKVPVQCVCVDSGGHHTEHVYRYCKLRADRRVFPVRGGNTPGIPLVTRPTMHNRYRVKLFTLGVDTAKDVIYSRLRIPAPGPGYMHLPDWADLEYANQLTAERCIRKYVKGKGATRQWVKIRERNEALDLSVYALAALHILGPTVVQSLKERADRLAVPAEQVAERIAAAERATRALPRRIPWIDRWRY